MHFILANLLSTRNGYGMVNVKRRRLPVDREGKTVKATIGNTDVYIRTGEYEDGTLGEVFITINKDGDRMRVYDCLAIMISLSLQHGVQLELIIDKLRGQRMEPSGVTNHPKIPIVSSISDFLVRWLEKEYLG